MLGRRKSGRISVLPKSSAVQSQEKELVKAVHEMKEFRLSSDFKYLEIDADKCCLNSPLDSGIWHLLPFYKLSGLWW